MKPPPQEHAWERTLISLAVALGAHRVAGYSDLERILALQAQPAGARFVRETRDKIRAGLDPLGDLLAFHRSAEDRRDSGATYTPRPIVEAMMEWASEQGLPDRIIDPGVGSGRFLCAAAQMFEFSHLIGVEIDPLAALAARANLAALGCADRARIEVADYRADAFPFEGTTMFLGNPPYVRHHQIDPAWKKWLVERAGQLKLKASQLAGLHVYFYLATVLKAKAGDGGAFITAAEWMDVNYGSLVRELFLGALGGHSITVLEPTVRAFPDAATTAAIVTFKVASKPKSIRLRRVKKLEDLRDLAGGRWIRRERLEAEDRWSRLTHAGRECPEGYVELGELCRVHRGSVTGANGVWIAGEHARDVPERFLFPSVTKAREIIKAGRILEDATILRRVVDLPESLDALEPSERARVERFLAVAKDRGADRGYIATHRRAWWSVRLRAAAPILATYMARRPPTFVHNAAEARHLNIAHGLYPRDPLTDEQLSGLVNFLATGVNVRDGRTYAGGLTKFEPGEMERIYVPGPQLLAAVAA
jgi:adenine-specific DNA-methyltransferase